jgi:DNA-binding HxlR family transcriptional regulator
MKKAGLLGRRSDCPVNFAVETIGDKWSLVILRDIIFHGKCTYGEFLRSDEKIATNILASRLEYLEKEGLISREPHETDKRTEIYKITERGIELVPVLIEMVAWSANDSVWQSMKHSGTEMQRRFVERAAKAKNRPKLVEEVKAILRRGRFVFEGMKKAK